VCGILIGFSAGVAMECHGSIAIGILGLAVALIYKIRTNWKIVISVLGSFVAVYLPWFCYQKFIDPPGDRLFKWYFAGVTEVVDQSFLQVFVEQYSSTDLWQIICNKLANIKCYFFCSVDNVYYADFYCLASVLSVVAFGLFMLFDKKTRQGLDKPRYFYLLRALIFSMLIAAITYFDANTTVIHQSPYSNILLGFSLAGALCERMPLWGKCLMLCAALIKFILGYCNQMIDTNNFNLLSALLSFLALGLVILLVRYLCSKSDDDCCAEQAVSSH